MKVLINGKIKDIKKTSIDTGYFYGYGVFETILVHKGEAVFAKEHVNRLNKSVKKLSIKQSVTIQEVEHAVAALRLYNGALKNQCVRKERCILHKGNPLHQRRL